MPSPSQQSTGTKIQPTTSSNRLVVAPSHRKAHAVHVANWQACKLCNLCKTRTQTVLFRGHIPCDVLFIGEAPGTAEDATGWPFIGPAGQLFDSLVDDALLSLGYGPPGNIGSFHPRGLSGFGELPYKPDRKTYAPRMGVTNIVACLSRLPPPTETLDGKTYELGTGMIRPPTRQEAETCAPRVTEIMAICTPKLIVTLGKEATKYVPQVTALGSGCDRVIPTYLSLLHPSHILRLDNDPNQRSNARILAEKRFILTLSEALEKL